MFRLYLHLRLCRRSARRRSVVRSARRQGHDRCRQPGVSRGLAARFCEGRLQAGFQVRKSQCRRDLRLRRELQRERKCEAIIMSTDLQNLVNQPYQHGFVTEIESDVAPKGLNEDIIRMISAKKQEPEGLIEFRLKA